MVLSRRMALSAGLAATCAGRAVAGTTTDLAVSCDAAAGPAVLAAAAAYRQQTGVRVRVFPTLHGLLLPQLERDIQNDVIVTQMATIGRAAKEGLIQPGKSAGPWRNPLAIATAADAPPGMFAVPDASPASDIDGFAIARKLGTATDRVVGMLNTGAVAWAMVNGDARRGLLHQTEIRTDGRLRAQAAVPDDVWPPILYGATVTTLAWRGDPAAFVAFLASPAGRAVLLAAGLEDAA